MYERNVRYVSGRPSHFFVYIEKYYLHAYVESKLGPISDYNDQNIIH